MDNVISYAVIALDKSKVDKVIALLETNGKYIAVTEWLKNNKSRVYGESFEDWRPFGGDKIQEIIEKNSEAYNSENHLIGNYLEHYPEATVDLSHINVFFIDIFSMYLEEYKELARRTDQAFCSGEKNSCCFLIDYNLPNAVQKELEGIYHNAWPLVSREYPKGCLHRMAARIDDLNNFKNYLKIKKVEDIPNSTAKETANNIISKKTGGLYEKFPRPSF